MAVPTAAGLALGADVVVLHDFATADDNRAQAVAQKRVGEFAVTDETLRRRRWHGTAGPSRVKNGATAASTGRPEASVAFVASSSGRPFPRRLLSLVLLARGHVRCRLPPQETKGLIEGRRYAWAWCTYRATGRCRISFLLLDLGASSRRGCP